MERTGVHNVLFTRCINTTGIYVKQVNLLYVHGLILQREPVVRVFSAVTGETLSVLGTVFLLSTSVARLMTLVSQQCELPVSSFRLSSPTGLQLYDCNRLHDYAIDLGMAFLVQ